MPRLKARDRQRLARLDAALRTFVDGAPPAMAELVGPLGELLEADTAIAWSLSPRGEGLRVEWLHTSTPAAPAIRADFDRYLDRRPVGWAIFNPVRPEPMFRNQAMLLAEVKRMTAAHTTPIARDLFPKWGFDVDQVRVLVCDGVALLGFVGAFRETPLGPREKRILAALTPALQRRLRLERDAETAPLARAALGAALAALPGAALLADRHGRIEHANAAARALVRRDCEREDVLAAIADRPSAWEATRVAGAGLPERWLLVRRDAGPGEKIAAAAQRWALGARQRAVLALVAQGLSNKAVAARLGCSESAVELRVTQIFRRAGVKGRAELVAAIYA